MEKKDKDNNENKIVIKKYSDFIDYLLTFEDLDYKEFSKKITPTNYEIIGIRVPIIRKIAKDLKEYSDIILSEKKTIYFEELFVKFIMIANLKDESKFLFYFKIFSEYLDNWAICDSFASTLKFIDKDKDHWLDFIKRLTKSKHEFICRLGFVMLLDHYVEREYIDTIFILVDECKLDKYYVNMAISWLLAECYIKERDLFTENIKLIEVSDFIYNKTISKICDSLRISKEEKEHLRSLRK